MKQQSAVHTLNFLHTTPVCQRFDCKILASLTDLSLFDYTDFQYLSLNKDIYMEFFDVIANRFSYRKALDPTPLPLEDLKKIVQAGLDAPSGKNEQTTGFIIIQDEEVVKKIKAMPGANGSMATAPAYIACHINKKPIETYFGSAFDIEDCAAAVENILLAATALGYASVWIDGWLRSENRAETIGEWCSLEDDRVIRILIPLGKALAEQRRPSKRGFDERVTIV